VSVTNAPTGQSTRGNELADKFAVTPPGVAGLCSHNDEKPQPKKFLLDNFMDSFHQRLLDHRLHIGRLHSPCR
jgi:hypothetical protein